MVRHGLMYRLYTALFRPFSPCSLTKLISVQRSHYGIPLRARRLRRFYAPWIRPGARCFDIG